MTEYERMMLRCEQSAEDMWGELVERTPKELIGALVSLKETILSIWKDAYQTGYSDHLFTTLKDSEGRK